MPKKILEEFDPTRSLEDAHRPPYSWYIDRDFFDQERWLIFERFWIPVGRTDQVLNVGDYLTGTLLNNPYVVVRTEDGLRALHNVCRHMGAEVARAAGRCDHLVCPYHGWEYHLDGRLKKAPLLGKQQDFNIERNSLPAIAVSTWGPFIFIDMDGPFGGKENPRDLQKDIEPLRAYFEPEFPRFKFYQRRVYEIQCNWKVFVDNGLDGGYHVAYAHEDLAAGLEFGGYETHVWDRTSLQVCGTKQTDRRLGEKVMYAYVYPNLFINLYGHCMDTNVVIPLSPESCRVVFDFYFDYEDFGQWSNQRAMEKSCASSHAIQLEDQDVCESVQRGMNSMSFKYGRYSSLLERAVHEFHVRLYRDLKGWLD